MMCDGSSLSDTSGGIRKPVALVRIVNSRNIAVRPGIRLEPSIPNITIMPATMPIRLMMTWTVTNVDKLIPRIMMRSPFRIDQISIDQIATAPDRELPFTRPDHRYANRTPHGFHVACDFCRIARSILSD